MPTNVPKQKMRSAYADTVIELAKADARIVFVSSDCGLHEREFLKTEGQGRMIETGLAEANAAAVAAGLAAEGFVPHLLNFAYLLGRMYNQISQSICEDAYIAHAAGFRPRSRRSCTGRSQTCRRGLHRRAPGSS